MLAVKKPRVGCNEFMLHFDLSIRQVTVYMSHVSILFCFPFIIFFTVSINILPIRIGTNMVFIVTKTHEVYYCKEVFTVAL